MATIHMVCTRKIENSNITFGRGVFNGLTVTGEIYKASEYESEYEDENGLIQIADLSNNLRKIIATVTFRGTEETYSAIKMKVATYFQEAANENIFEIKVGLVINSTKLELVNGTHPQLGIPTKTLLVNSARLLDVEEPDVKDLAQNVVAKTAEARENATERKTTGLAAVLANGVKKTASMFGKTLFDSNAAKMADNFIDEKLVEDKKKVGRPPKVKC